MTLANRRRLLALAKKLDLWAMKLRQVVKQHTPKRVKVAK